MLKRIIAFSIAVIMIFSFAGCTKTTGFSNEYESNTVKIVKSDNKYRLFVDEKTAYISIIDDKEKEILQLDNLQQYHISVTYYDENDSQKIINSKDCPVTTEKISDNEYRVSYVISEKQTYSTLDLPTAITEKRLKSFLEKMTEAESKKVLKYYRFVSLDDLEGDEKNEYISNYPSIKDDNIYLLRSVEDFVGEAIAEIFYTKAGYSAEELKKDNSQNGIKDNENTIAEFVVPVLYKLEENTLSVSVDCSKMTVGGGHLSKLSLLPYAGCADAGSDGFIFIPDGMGAMLTHTVKTNDSAIEIPIYGNDSGIRKNTSELNCETQMLPVFGIKNNNISIMTIIEDSPYLASVTANSVKSGQPHCAYASYSVGAVDFVKLTASSSSSVTVYPDNIYEGIISQRLVIFEDKDTSWENMAYYYRDYLDCNNGFNSTLNDNKAVIELIGNIKKEKTILGIVTYKKDTPLTTYSQVAKIVDEFAERGADKLAVKYSGAVNGSLTQTKLDKIKPIKCLSDITFDNLIKSISEQNADISFNFDIYSNTAGAAGNTARLLGDSKTIKYDYDVVTGYKKTIGQLPYLKSYPAIDKSLAALSNWKQTNISLSNFSGSYSDFTDNNYASRQDMAYKTEAFLKDLDKEKFIMVEKSSMEALKIADIALTVPLESNNYDNSYQAVPFLQYVLHGKVNYTGETINLSQNYKYEMLKTVEYGAIPHFTFTYAGSEEVIDTEYADMYSLCYKEWIDEAGEYINKLTLLMKDVRDKKIISHTARDGIAKTTYENGITIVVNYNTNEFYREES